MCSAPEGIDYEEQQRLANLGKIKAKHKAKVSKIDVVMGGGVKEYRRSMATGAKEVGTSALDIKNKKLSDLFTGNIGKRQPSRFGSGPRRGPGFGTPWADGSPEGGEGIGTGAPGLGGVGQ